MTEYVAIRTQYLYFFLLGNLTYLGMQFRSTVGIITIAVVIYIIITPKKKLLYKLISIVLGIIVAYLFWGAILIFGGLPLNPDKAVPITHWITMGLSGEGKWAADLWNLTDSVPTKKEKIALNIRTIQDIFAKNTLKDWGGLFLKKLSIMWSNGLSGIRGNQSIVTHFGKAYEYTVGDKGFIVGYWSQVVRCANLLFLIPILIKHIKSKKYTVISACIIFLFGYILFYCFWEVHESYILTCMPILYILSACGLVSVYRWWIEIKAVVVVKHKSDYYFSKQEFYRYSKKLMVFVMLMTILLACVNAPKLIVDIDSRNELRVNQPSGNKYSELSLEKTVQIFQAENIFNSVDIKFINDNIVDQKYIFLLENSYGEILAENEFSSNDIKNEKYYTFRFEDVLPNGIEEYAIVLSSVNKYEKNISICGVSDKKNDYYDFGQLIVNGKNIGDMNFKVYWNTKGTLISKRVYFSLIVFCVLIELNLYVWISRILMKSVTKNES